jgi:hypothetical protein
MKYKFREPLLISKGQPSGWKGGKETFRCTSGKRSSNVYGDVDLFSITVQLRPNIIWVRIRELVPI